MMTKKKTPVSDADKALFRSMTKDVRRLQHDRIDPPNALQTLRDKRLNRAAMTQTPRSSRQVPFVEHEYLDPVQAEDTLSYCGGGLRHKTLKQLRNGQIQPSAQLDLHGLSIADAGSHCHAFINMAQKQNHRCVLIIHGRGSGSAQNRPIIKQQLNYWLRHDHRVLAFHSAIPQHGGSGAVYVMIRKIKSD